jgi:glycosyltransferase involved in cell wall biosynthesis
VALNRKGHLAVFLATSGHSGVDKVMGNLLPSIAQRGVRVDLLRVKGHGPFIEASNNLRLVDLGSAHTYSSLLPLARYLRQYKPDVLLSDKDRVNRVALLARKAAGTNTRVVVRTGTTVSLDLTSRRPINRMLTLLSMKHLYRGAQKIILPSEAAVQDFREVTGHLGELVTAVPSPVATPELYGNSKAPVTHPWLLEKTGPVIVGIGELSDRKDFATLIRAFAVVRSKYPAKLIILGEGRRRSCLEKMVLDLNLFEAVLLPGFEKNPYPILAGADLYVHSSRQEGSPVALMEAVALGVPCVSTDCPSGPSEILQGGRIGALVKVGDVESMATAMFGMLEAPPEREFIIKAAEPFTVENSTDSYMEVLGFSEVRGNPL